MDMVEKFTSSDIRARLRNYYGSQEWAGLRFFEVLKQIANGHNDHRSLAVEAIRDFEKWKLI
jgi:hypothetical protein